MIIVFIGPPYSGKDTQSKLIASDLGIPIFSMGSLIRKAYKEGNPKAIEGFEQYSMKGLHVPISLKFALLRERMDEEKDGFILDNFPATLEDLETFKEYLQEKSLKVDKVFSLKISEEEMIRRRTQRGRADDEVDILLKRREEQDKDRIPVIEYFKSTGILKEINDEGQTVEETHQIIMEEIYDKN